MIIQRFNDAVLLFNKPYRWTSFDVVKKVRSLTALKKAGHAGTLDPLATGLLILCTGKMTKSIESFQHLTKEYTGCFTLGAVTPSYDLETAVTEQQLIDHVTPEMIYEAAGRFLGEQDQLPPPHSAKHHQGIRYYQLAREGAAFDLKPHRVTLFEFEITALNLPELSFRLVCGKGYYVRSLAHDFGKALGTGAYLSQLCRTRIGEHHLKDAWQLEDFTKFVHDLKTDARSLPS